MTGWRQALQVAILSGAEQRDPGKRLSLYTRAAPFAHTPATPPESTTPESGGILHEKQVEHAALVQSDFHIAR